MENKEETKEDDTNRNNTSLGLGNNLFYSPVVCLLPKASKIIQERLHKLPSYSFGEIRLAWRIKE